MRGPLVAAPREHEAAWQELAKTRDPADVDRLLDSKWPRSTPLLRARIAALAAFEPDPRITRTLGALAPRFTSQQYQPLQNEIVALLARAPTAAISRAVQLLGHSVYTPLYRPAERAFEQLERRSAEPALLALAAQSTTPRRALDELWAQHRAHPGDLEHRAVLADALTAANDPRGEFITAQLAIASGHGTPQLRKRANELLAAHLIAWMGPVPYYDKDAVIFERGFPVYVRCPTYTQRLVDSADAPEWTTVEELVFNHYDVGDITPLLAKLPLLRALSAAPDILQLLAKTGPHAGIRTLDLAQREWWPERTTFPDLEVLAGRWTIESDAEAKRHAETAAKLGVTIVHTNMAAERIARIVEHRRFGPPETRLSFGGVYVRAHRWCVRLRRDDATADMTWAGTRVGYDEDDQASEALAALVDAGIDSIRLVVTPRAKFPKLDATVKRLANKVTITRDGAPIIAK
ncbi:MAG: hypothetical protein HOV81_41860 [Kofleriaceae bacterium]|nr:hypothetical protein [Kofleriaceae bacterium]